MYSRAMAALLSLLVVSGAAVVTAVVGYVMASPTFGWTGAGYSRSVCAHHSAGPARTCCGSQPVSGTLLLANCNAFRQHIRALLNRALRQLRGPQIKLCQLSRLSRPRGAGDPFSGFDCAGRSLSLLDPTYASKYIPIIASVSEHQPPAWPSYFTDLNFMVT